MGQQLVHKENIMLNLSATDKESVLSQMSDVLFQNGFVKSTFKDAVIDREKEFATGLPTHLCSVAIPHTDVEQLMQIFQSEEKLEQILRTKDETILATLINDYLKYN
ncbi:TPA: PTS sugar transporter subunit IIA [Staphylococcus aureus]|nr:PTS sugar transporter subunit IIA [Staphylococcus aureus]